MAITGMEHFNINCSDYERSKAFYAVLGFQEVWPVPETNTPEVAAAVGMPPYPHLYHYGIARVALKSTDLEGDMANYYITVMEHYEMTSDHFKEMKGDYATNAQLLREAGMEDAAKAFVEINTFGTPRQILDKMEARRKQIGDFDLTVQVSYGGLTGEQAEKSINLFSKEVLPEIQSWQTY